MFYFLLAFIAVLAATANAGAVIRDVKGVPVFNGKGSYYLRPLFPYGGLTLSPRGGNQCPLYIRVNTWQPGVPVIISDPSTSAYVYETYDLNIKMDVKATTCAQPTYWSVSTPDTVIKPAFIVAGPTPSNGSFQIKKTGDAIGRYKIMFCPTGKDCTDVSIFVDPADGVSRLALSFMPYDRPFVFEFVKATGTETSSKTMSI
ncbi:hypothetical protein Bca4012_027820 [Brassica carinata]